MAESLMTIAARGELKPEVELRAFWNDFCDADPHPENFDSRMEAAGLISLEDVTDEDLDNAFAGELGIEPGGKVWRLTEEGRQALLTSGAKDQ